MFGEWDETFIIFGDLYLRNLPVVYDVKNQQICVLESSNVVNTMPAWEKYLIIFGSIIVGGLLVCFALYILV